MRSLGSAPALAEPLPLSLHSVEILGRTDLVIYTFYLARLHAVVTRDDPTRDTVRGAQPTAHSTRITAHPKKFITGRSSYPIYS